jgi:hypothetical protein
LSQATDWQELGCEISDIKNEEAGMNDRSKQLWLPGLVTPDGVDGLTHDASASKLEPWKQLVSRKPTARNGGTLIARLAGGIFPSIALLGLLIFITFTGFFVERNPFFWKHPAFFALVVFPWAILPAISLLIGVVPFVKMTKPKQA